MKDNRYHDALCQLMEAIGMPDADDLDNQAYVLTVDEKIEIHLVESAESEMTLFTRVGELSTPDNVAQLRYLMSRNLFPDTAPQTTLALDEDDNAILLWSRINLAQCDRPLLIAQFEGFLAAAEKAIAEITDQWQELSNTTPRGASRFDERPFGL